jgi:PAS domain S-box-containing protein
MRAFMRALVGRHRLAIGVRSWLFMLVLGTLLPSLCVGGAAAWLAVSSSRLTAEARLLDTARALALAVDRQIEEHISALVTLAAAPALDTDPADIPGLRQQAEAMSRKLGTAVVLRGPAPDFRLKFSTRSQALSPLRLTTPSLVNSAVPRALETGRPAVSDLVEVGPGVEPNIGVFVPVIRDGEARFGLGAILTPRRLSHLLEAPTRTDDVVATITDSQGDIIARSRDLDGLLGQHRPDRQEPLSSISGIIDGQGIRGRLRVRIAYARIESAPGWLLWVSQPQATLAATWQRPALMLGLGALAALALAGLFAMLVARRIVGPLEHLARRAEASTASAGAGPPLAAIAPTLVRELERLRVALDGADRAMRRHLASEQDAHLALRDSEARFRAMADNIPQLAWMARPDGWLFWYNQRWYDYTGTTLEQMRGWGWRKVHHPDHMARVTMHFRERVHAGEPWEDTFPLRSRSGEWRWFLSRALPIRDRTGRVVLWFGTNTDITAQREAEAALAASEERLRLAIDSTGLATLDANLETGIAVATPNLFTARGLPVPEDGRTSLAAIRETLHPEDRERVLAAAIRAETEGGPCHTIHRIIRADTGEVRWMEVIAQVRREADGHRRWVSVQIDVTDRVAAEDQRLLLAREVDHRAKNVLAVVQALLALTPTGSEDARRFAEAVGSRVTAMARAHALLARERWVGAELRTLVEEELAPYAAERPDAIRLDGPGLRLPARLAQPLSLVLHELATNAAKYGALSLPTGQLVVTWRTSPAGLLLDWHETGGPALAGAPAQLGFGSRLVARTLRHQLQGHAEFLWHATGLQCLLTLPLLQADEVAEE